MIDRWIFDGIIDGIIDDPFNEFMIGERYDITKTLLRASVVWYGDMATTDNG